MPVTLALILVVAIVDKALPADVNPWIQAGVLLAVNIMFALLTLEIVRRFASRRRAEVEMSRAESQETSEPEPAVTAAG